MIPVEVTDQGEPTTAPEAPAVELTEEEAAARTKARLQQFVEATLALQRVICTGGKHTELCIEGQGQGKARWYQANLYTVSGNDQDGYTRTIVAFGDGYHNPWQTTVNLYQRMRAKAEEAAAAFSG